jgi:hypothetical protein
MSFGFQPDGIAIAQIEASAAEHECRADPPHHTSGGHQVFKE